MMRYPIKVRGMTANLFRLRLAAAVLLLVPASVSDRLAIVVAAAEPREADYQRDVRSVFKHRCWSCHGALQQQSALRLDTVAAMTQGGDSGPAIIAGKPQESLVWQRLTATDASERMPPEGAALSAEEIAVIAHWIADGAVAPEQDEPEPDPREHWSFRAPVRATPPVIPGRPGLHPIDAFIEHSLKREQLVPGPAADPATLLRRVYLDLVGVPPTPAELQAFLADDSDSAYERVVDALLQDPRHGERWGRHWLDIWRYSDWYGRRHVPDVWNSAPQIWRWRDWTVQSLNADLGYDQMLRLMLAGDELAPEDAGAAVATGYLIRNWYALNPNDWMRNTVEHTGKAFLGLTFNCAHCHDHKYDPISHDDYFRLRAFFEPIAVRQDRAAGQADPGLFQEYSYGVLRKVQKLGAVRVFDKTPDAPTWFYTGGDERNRVADRGSITPGVPTIFQHAAPVAQPVALPVRGYYPGLHPDILATMRSDAAEALRAAEQQLEQTRSTSPAPDDELLQKLAQAEAAYQAVLNETVAGDKSSAKPAGSQALTLNAVAGRRILNHGLKSLPDFHDGMTLEFRLKLLADAHFNFQLADHFEKGQTASCIIFEKGQIRGYQPGTVSEFLLAKYDFAAGEQQYLVHLRFDLPADRCLLTITAEPSSRLLVDAVPIALNGWNPLSSAAQGITFDARTGSVVALDDIALRPHREPVSAAGQLPAPVLAIDFEAPRFKAEADVVGVDGWMASSFSAAPATSVISDTVLNEVVLAARTARDQVQRELDRVQLPLRSAEAQRSAAEALQESLEARIAAEQAKYGLEPTEDLVSLKRHASQLERNSVLLSARAELLKSKLAVQVAEQKPTTDAGRAKELEAANKAVTQAVTAVASAEAKLSDAALAETYAPLSPIYPETSTGRRTALANWLVDRDHPLTARVAVNHVWLRHFHAPLVSTVYDFGRNGATPTHPELLDWLAVEFMESGWSLRHLHRLLVTSEAYRRSSAVGELASNREIDPDNRWLWRMNVGRMEVEAIRDSLLATAGKLDLTMGGPELENEVALTTFRRSLYYSVYPENGGKSALGELFDGPNANDCYQRTQTIIPQQALALTNSELVHALSGDVLKELSPQTGEFGTRDLDGFIVAAFERILSRRPNNEELQLCRSAIERQTALLTAEQVPNPLLKACESIVRALYNHNDFVTIR